jgi:hypothetical protein
VIHINAIVSVQIGWAVGQTWAIDRIPAVLPIAEIICISGVPGFVKQTSTPLLISVCSMLSAPFIQGLQIIKARVYLSTRAKVLAPKFGLNILAKNTNYRCQILQRPLFHSLKSYHET